MSLSKDQAKALLREGGLRVTAPRVAVVRLLAVAEGPVSYSEVLLRLGDADWDPATIFRSLVKLREVGLAPVVSRADGTDRYVLATSAADQHQHPHFVCEDCGRTACLPLDLPEGLVADLGPWSRSVKEATLQLRGECPDCIEPVGE